MIQQTVSACVHHWYAFATRLPREYHSSGTVGPYWVDTASCLDYIHVIIIISYNRLNDATLTVSATPMKPVVHGNFITFTLISLYERVFDLLDTECLAIRSVYSIVIK